MDALPTPLPKAFCWEWKVVFISDWGLAGKEIKLGAIDSHPQEKEIAQGGQYWRLTACSLLQVSLGLTLASL